MEKIWYISIKNVQEGPYSVEDLKWDERITPDTLVWRKGFPRWVPIRDVPELRKIFKDDRDEDQETDQKITSGGYDEVALTYQQDPNTFLWIIVGILAILYSLYQFYIFT